jgi:hypothetical protein
MIDKYHHGLVDTTWKIKTTFSPITKVTGMFNFQNETRDRCSSAIESGAGKIGRPATYELDMNSYHSPFPLCIVVATGCRDSLFIRG